MRKQEGYFVCADNMQPMLFTIDIKIQRVITEYRAEILEDQNGNQTVADFPDKVKRQVQYGDSVKAQAQGAFAR
jgi:hypothetical protein